MLSTSFQPFNHSVNKYIGSLLQKTWSCYCTRPASIPPPQSTKQKIWVNDPMDLTRLGQIRYKWSRYHWINLPCRGTHRHQSQFGSKKVSARSTLLTSWEPWCLGQHHVFQWRAYDLALLYTAECCIGTNWSCILASWIYPFMDIAKVTVLVQNVICSILYLLSHNDTVQTVAR